MPAVLKVFNVTSTKGLQLHLSTNDIYVDIQIQYKTMKFRVKNSMYEGWNFNSGNYLFTTDTK